MLRAPFPWFHFFHPGCWINDPNGLVHSDGVYHLFYQLNPDETVWGNIHWGHATSMDLIHWETYQPAMVPTPGSGFPFSGTAVLSEDDGSRERLLAMYTRSKPTGTNDYQAQYLAEYDRYSGRFYDLADVPAIDNGGAADFRDPKLWRRGEYWHCVIATGDHLEFFRSRDLTGWERTSVLSVDTGRDEYVVECPDLITFRESCGVTVDVLLLSVARRDHAYTGNVLYTCGVFDGMSFVSDGADWRPLDNGHDFYAAQTWGNLSGGVRTLVAWMNNWAYAEELSPERWNGCLSIPRTLTMERRGERCVVNQQPIRQLERLCGPVIAPDREGAAASWIDLDTASFLLTLDWRIDRSPRVEVEIGDRRGRTVRIRGELRNGVLFMEIDRSDAWNRGTASGTVASMGGTVDEGVRSVDVALYVDTCSIELFADRGSLVATELVLWEPGGRRCAVVAHGEEGGVRCSLRPIDPIVLSSASPRGRLNHSKKRRKI
ncbi:MAG: glycoside hydrolase family 32 protein [Spirochaetales bacterium]|nr:glycoside hydrolase family 32 protein [Spirochaetales bacterium]